MVAYGGGDRCITVWVTVIYLNNIYIIVCMINAKLKMTLAHIWTSLFFKFKARWAVLMGAFIIDL